MDKKIMGLRIDEESRKLLELCARQERRSMSNMMEIMIIDYCKRYDVKLKEDK